MDHFSGNPQAGCRVTYPIRWLYVQVDWICQHWPTFNSDACPYSMKIAGLLVSGFSFETRYLVSVKFNPQSERKSMPEPPP